MAPAAKIAAGAALAGLMLAVMVMGARQPAPPRVTVTVVPDGEMPDRLRDTLARCRAATMPESGCEAAWDAERRHFFGDEGAGAPAGAGSGVVADPASGNKGDQP